MDWLQKLPSTCRSPAGWERAIWRKLPVVLLVGTVVPIAGWCLWYAFMAGDTAAELRWVQMVGYAVVGAVLFHWTAVLTVGIGCAIVMLMKGPGYVADGFPVSHSDQPRDASLDRL
nr:hypothetical protein [uncultured Albidiferax sp.]